MSRKSRRNEPRKAAPAPERAEGGGIGRRGLFIGAAAAMLLAFAGGALFYRSEVSRVAARELARNRSLLASEHSPALGDAQAKVHVVEFLDPACETCAAFYPEVKKLMAAHPERIRVSVRHVAFHDGSASVVAMLEAARSQGKYEQALGAVLAAQERWTENHRVYPERAWPVLEAAGVDLARIRGEMGSTEIALRMEKDATAARVLGVTKTPEYFVNGRPLPRFGLQELKALVDEALRESYGGASGTAG